MGRVAGVAAIGTKRWTTWRLGFLFMPAARLVAPFAAVATAAVSASTPGDRDSRDECEHENQQFLLDSFGLDWFSFIERLFLMKGKKTP
jgi:hypothetical protein